MSGRREVATLAGALIVLFGTTASIGLVRAREFEQPPTAHIGVGQSIERRGMRFTFLGLTDRDEVPSRSRPDRPNRPVSGATFVEAVVRIEMTEVQKVKGFGCQPILRSDSGEWEPDVGISTSAGQLHSCFGEAEDLTVPGTSHEVHWYFETNPAWQRGRRVEVAFYGSEPGFELRP